MKRRSLVFLAILLLVFSATAKQGLVSADVDTYKSPDLAVVASITSSKAHESMHESRVELRTKTGSILARTDYSSEDGEHGYVVARAEWTPDSKFSVYSLESSGGHSPWHSPVQFYSRKLNKILSLDDALNDAVMSPLFGIQAPDRVTVELYFRKKERTVSLSTLLTSK